jgi:hypothetical protein
MLTCASPAYNANSLTCLHLEAHSVNHWRILLPVLQRNVLEFNTGVGWLSADVVFPNRLIFQHDVFFDTFHAYNFCLRISVSFSCFSKKSANLENWIRACCLCTLSALTKNGCSHNN